MKKGNEKYYVPTIEEFHLGYEYEFNDSDDESRWQKSIIKDGAQINDIFREYRNERVYSLRVKHLDRQNIEAEGWIHTGKDEEFDYIGYSGPDNLQLQYWEGQGYSIEKDPHAEYKSVYFCGNIRNRSELRTLMNMLGITKK